MVNWEEHRRAPRTIVDVEARLHLTGHAPTQGIIQDLSALGSLFVPEEPLPLEPNSRGRLRFAMPTAVSWLEPHIEVRRITSYTRPDGRQAQAIAFEFSGLTHEQERAITAGCHEWQEYRTRRYTLACRCFVESAGREHFARYGRLTNGSRAEMQLSLAAGFEAELGVPVRLKAGSATVGGRIEHAVAERASTDVRVRLEGWGRDFFLHEARRQAMQ